MKWGAILIAIGLQGCVTDHLIAQADRYCYDTTRTKDEYRDCLAKEYENLKADIDAAICEVTK